MSVLESCKELCVYLLLLGYYLSYALLILWAGLWIKTKQIKASRIVWSLILVAVIVLYELFVFDRLLEIEKTFEDPIYMESAEELKETSSKS